MGKRKGESSGNRNKKYKVSGFIDPNTRGIYATCNRGRELGCRKELMTLLTERIEALYPEWEKYIDEEIKKVQSPSKDSEKKEENGNEKDSEVKDETDEKKDDQKDDEKKEETTERKPLSVEEQIKLELEEIKSTQKTAKSHPLLHPIELGCECLVFVKVRRPASPVDLVKSLCQQAVTTGQKNTRWTQKLSPVSYSVSASMDELHKLASKVLAPHFHAKDQKPVKFAIQVTRRNFNSLEKEDIIKNVAGVVGRDNNHTVDLKNYDKLIMVECYKNNIGMSVVDDFLQYEKFNLQQIFEKNMGESVSRV